ncbi:MAG: LptA/OstA family protein [Gammaproteobacteria bacterium]
MAFLNPESVKAFVLAAVLFPGMALGILPNSKEPISLEADSSEFDKDKNQLVFRKVRITQAGLSIVADTAVADGLDFSQSVWTFTGQVNIDGEGSHIRGSRAQLVFTNHRLTQATTTGQPATFDREQDPVEDVRALSGDALSIQYDALASTLVLDGDARLLDGSNEITGDRLMYNILEDKLVASSDDASQVRIVITPQPEITETDSNGEATPPESDGTELEP